MMKLYRSQRDKKIFGLCGGLAETLNVDATILRLVLVVTAFFSGGTVILIYIIAGLIIPKEPLSDYSWGQRANPPSIGSVETPFKTQASAASSIDEMMKDIEKKAMQKEIEELRAKLAKYEKGE